MPGCARRLTARAAGARVIVLESAPRHFRGGNSRHTRNLRVRTRRPTAVLTEAYTEDEFSTDLLRVSGEHRRGAGPARDQRVGRAARSGWPARRAVPVVAAGHAAPGAHERLLPRRRQGADEQLLRRRRRRWGSRCATTPSVETGLADGRFESAVVRTPAGDRGRARPRPGARVRRLRVEPRSGCARRGDPRPTTSSSAARRTIPAASCG